MGKGRDAFQEVTLKWEEACFKGNRVCEKMKVGKVTTIQTLGQELCYDSAYMKHPKQANPKTEKQFSGCQKLEGVGVGGNAG